MSGNRDGAPPRRGQPSVEFQREHQIGKLGLAVAFPGIVPLLRVQIIEIDPPAPVGDTGRGNDAAAMALFELIQQQTGQREGREVIHPELRFKAVLRQRKRRVHDAGIVDQKIEPRFFFHLVRCRADAGEAGLIERDIDQIGQRIGRLDLSHRLPRALL